MIIKSALIFILAFVSIGLTMAVLIEITPLIGARKAVIVISITTAIHIIGVIIGNLISYQSDPTP